MFTKTALLALSALLLLPADARADKSPEPVAGCSLTDLTLIGGFNAGNGASYCQAFDGKNDSEAHNLTWLTSNHAALGPWTSLGKSDGAGNGPFTSNPNSTSGSLTFDDPRTGFFAISLKGASGFAIYVLDAGSGPGGATGVSFSMQGVPLNNGGNEPGLSHAMLLDGRDAPPCQPGDDCGPSVIVPEPASLALVATGFVGLVAVGRRRRR